MDTVDRGQTRWPLPVVNGALCARGGVGDIHGVGKGKAVFTNRFSITEEGVTLTVVCQTVVCVYVHLHSGHSLSCMGWDGGGPCVEVIAY